VGGCDFEFGYDGAAQGGKMGAAAQSSTHFVGY